MMATGIGGTVRAARERRGWSREELAVRSGLSWAAITQIESGRRCDVRISSLSALAGALDVGMDFLVEGPGASPSALLDHRALLFESDAQFLDGTVDFAKQGVERSEPVLVVTTRPRIAQMREALGDAADGIVLADSSDWYHSPAGALAAYQAFVGEVVASGAPWVRIVGEPVWPKRAPRQTEAWIRYESLINLCMAQSAVTLICPYDRRDAPAAVLAAAEQTHPELLHDGCAQRSTTYRTPEMFLLESPGWATQPVLPIALTHASGFHRGDTQQQGVR
jgi:transcriptional regulator with XRE-family HTH domain